MDKWVGWEIYLCDIINLINDMDGFDFSKNVNWRKIKDTALSET